MGGRDPDETGTIITPEASWTLAQLWGQRETPLHDRALAPLASAR
jgi:hypothetical protein